MITMNAVEIITSILSIVAMFIEAFIWGVIAGALIYAIFAIAMLFVDDEVTSALKHFRDKYSKLAVWDDN